MFERRVKEKKPVIAICYDFDKTLSPDNMQAQGFIQDVYSGDVEQFWKETQELSLKNEMDSNLAYMYKMFNEAEGRLIFNKKSLREYGAKVALYDGVESWFDRINHFAEINDVIVEHYIISSGIKEMIEGNVISKFFTKIYASSFYYNKRGIAIWPAQVVNFTNKTQFLFRISKGTLDVNDNEGVNAYFKPEDIRIPFSRIVYLGDSETDIPCMKLVKNYGGSAIGVFNPNTNNKQKVHALYEQNRINYYESADYSEGSKLEELVKSIIIRVKEGKDFSDLEQAAKLKYLKETNEL